MASVKKILATLAAALPAVASANNLIKGNLSADDYCWTDNAPGCVESVFGLFGDIVELLISIASILAAMFIMYAGWLYLSSAGDESKVKEAKSVFRNVGLGFLLLLCAWLIVVSILESLGAKSWLLQFFGR
jgi:hypothetical protein